MAAIAEDGELGGAVGRAPNGSSVTRPLRHGGVDVVERGADPLLVASTASASSGRSVDTSGRRSACSRRCSPYPSLPCSRAATTPWAVEALHEHVGRQPRADRHGVAEVDRELHDSSAPDRPSEARGRQPGDHRERQVARSSPRTRPPRRGAGPRPSRSRTSCRRRAARCRSTSSASPVTERPVSRPSAKAPVRLTAKRARREGAGRRAPTHAPKLKRAYAPSRAEARRRPTQTITPLIRSGASAPPRSPQPRATMPAREARERVAARQRGPGVAGEPDRLDLEGREGGQRSAEAGAEQEPPEAGRRDHLRQPRRHPREQHGAREVDEERRPRPLPASCGSASATPGAGQRAGRSAEHDRRRATRATPQRATRASVTAARASRSPCRPARSPRAAGSRAAAAGRSARRSRPPRTPRSAR